MSRFSSSTLAAVALVLSAGAASAQLYPLTNGPDGSGTNAVDSAKGFIGSNAVAPERELLYHPERAGNAAAQLGASAGPTGAVAADDAPTVRRRARPLGRHGALRRPRPEPVKRRPAGAGPLSRTAPAPARR